MHLEIWQNVFKKMLDVFLENVQHEKSWRIQNKFRNLIFFAYLKIFRSFKNVHKFKKFTQLKKCSKISIKAYGF